ncbi:MAG: transglycosylase SLT domain-containing protein [Porticoccaceae bacterium]|jgi:soluble lytic murein transglycosylase-like protein|nr:transglycosylase SLT domain-containing protein [Porticoccaceae bacterium]
MTGTRSRASLARLAMPLVLWASLAGDAGAAAMPGDNVDEELLRLLKRTVVVADSFEDRYDAEVWLLDKSTELARFIPDKPKRLEFLRKVHREASRAGLSPEVVLAVIEVESRFDPYAVSTAGALGLMQVMPFWKNEIGRPEDNLINVDVNLRYGCTILKYYLDKEDGRLREALARYNGSYGQYWYPQRVLLAWENRWR